MKTLFVAVAGGSGSGKSSFVADLCQSFQVKPTILAIDHYYKDLSHLSVPQRAQVNFDDPEAIEWPLLVNHIRDLRQGKSIQRPNYDFVSHTRTGTTTVAPQGVLIIDGIFSLWEPELLPLLDLKLYIECPSDMRLARRILRDSQARGREVAHVLEQYLQTVKPMHAKYIEPTKAASDFIIPWFERNPRSVAHVAMLLGALQNSQAPEA